ncbi:MAG TPA: SDR family oxidoreductase [Trebonia sp.]
MRVFVTGASGFIGSAVVADLIGAGHQVLGLARSQDSARRLAELGAAAYDAKLADLDKLAEAAGDADGVIHLAYRHGSPADEAAASDQRAIEAMGEALAGSDRPLVVTSGTLVLQTGRLGTEAGEPSPSAPAALRAAGERAALSLSGRGVRASVVRLAPCVHDRVRRGFVGALIGAAQRTGTSGYVGDGSQRWPAVHRLDAATLFRSALESAPAGSVLHGVGETGIPFCAIAEVIGTRLGLPVREIAASRASGHFGWIGSLAGADAPAASELTRELLHWEPSHAGLLDDLSHGDFFPAARP